MTPELRAAAERLIAHGKFERGEAAACDSPYYSWRDEDLDDPMRRSDVELVSKAILAENPAGDDEPITEEWLRSIGFVEGSGLGHLWLTSEFRLQAYETQNWHLETKDTTGDWYGCYHSLDLSKPTTRRQVRRLLESLGGRTKETTK